MQTAVHRGRRAGPSSWALSSRRGRPVRSPPGLHAARASSSTHDCTGRTSQRLGPSKPHPWFGRYVKDECPEARQPVATKLPFATGALRRSRPENGASATVTVPSGVRSHRFSPACDDRSLLLDGPSPSARLYNAGVGGAGAPAAQAAAPASNRRRMSRSPPALPSPRQLV